MTDDSGGEGDHATGTQTGVDHRLVPFPYQQLSATGTVRQVNQPWLDRLGYDRGAVLDRPFVELLGPESVERFQASFSELLDQGTVSAVPLELAHASGDRVAVLLDGRAEYEDGQVSAVHVQFQETDSERAARIRDQRAKIETLQELILDVQATRSAAVVFQTLVEAAERVLGFEAAAVEVLQDGAFHTQARSESAPAALSVDQRPVSDSLRDQVYRTGESEIVHDAEHGDHGYRSALVVPIEDVGVFQVVDSRPGAFDGVDRDLTELLVSHVQNALSRLERIETLHRRTASLSRERDRLEAVFEAVPEPVAHIRYESGSPLFVAVNSAFEELFGLDAAEIEGEDVNDLIVPPEQQDTAFDIDTAAETASSLEREVIRETADGPRTFRLRSTVLQTDAEPEILAIYVDLTEEKARERELKRENERLERFASIVAHDLRSPLTVARGRLELANVECESADLTAAIQAIERTDAIIEDVLTLTKGGQAVHETEREPVDLGTLARTCWESFDSPVAILDVTADGTVSADRSRLRRVFENLFRNAVEHAGPEVTVTVEDIDGGFAVADDGPGIPESERDQVFETGYTTARDGTGLGLDIVQDIVEAHGWTLTLADTDDGSRFEIRTGH